MVVAAKSKNGASLSRESWLEHSLEILREEGIQGVRVERLARDLGVTKGSFYWHFTDRNDLFESMLEYWIHQYNDVVTKNPQFLEGDPAVGLLAAMAKVRHEGLDQYELAMRAWADHDSQAHEAVQNVYQHRMKFIRGFFTRIGFRGLDAEIRTRLTLCYLSWEPNMYGDESESRRLSLLKRLQELLTNR
jgi:AcrR family transcriptional regulator